MNQVFIALANQNGLVKLDAFRQFIADSQAGVCEH
jgi:hypothetical protein